MTLEKYKKIRLAITVVIAMVFSQTIVLSNNYFLPIVLTIAMASLLMYFKSKIKEVLADERDYEIGGKAALVTIQIYSWITSIVMFLLYIFRDKNPSFESIAFTLAYTTCFLMLSYRIVFKYYAKGGSILRSANEK